MTKQFDNSMTTFRTRMFNRKHSFYVPFLVYVILVHHLTIVSSDATAPMVNSILHQPIPLHNDSVYVRPIGSGDYDAGSNDAITSMSLKISDKRIAEQVIGFGKMVHLKSTFSPVYCDMNTSDLPIIYRNDTEIVVSIRNVIFNEYNAAYLCLIIDAIEEQKMQEPQIYHLGLQSQFVR